MITLHEAIRGIHEELISSEQERIQKGRKALFVTEKMTIELSCVFSETNRSETNGGINAFSVFALDTETAKTIASERIQKVILEFKAIPPRSQNSSSQDQGNESPNTIPEHDEVNDATGYYSYKKK